MVESMRQYGFNPEIFDLDYYIFSEMSVKGVRKSLNFVGPEVSGNRLLVYQIPEILAVIPPAVHGQVLIIPMVVNLELRKIKIKMMNLSTAMNTLDIIMVI